MHPVAKTRPLPPLTEAEAYERACKLIKNDYQSFGEVEARRVIDGLLRGMDALTKAVEAMAMKDAA